jgi:hypothetical protein
VRDFSRRAAADAGVVQFNDVLAGLVGNGLPLWVWSAIFGLCALTISQLRPEPDTTFLLSTPVLILGGISVLYSFSHRVSPVFGLLILFLTVIVPALAQMSARRAAGGKPTLWGKLAQTAPDTKPTNGNGHKLAVVESRQEESSKRLDDTVRRLDDIARRFDDAYTRIQQEVAYIREDTRRSIEEIKSANEAKFNEWMEVSRRREDSWLIQFNQFRRAHADDVAKREKARTSEMRIVEGIRTDVEGTKQDIAVLRQDVNRLLEKSGVHDKPD